MVEQEQAEQLEILRSQIANFENDKRKVDPDVIN
jgi:CRP-like cAMP-binding protein